MARLWVLPLSTKTPKGPGLPGLAWQEGAELELVSHACGEGEAGILGAFACAQYADPQIASA